MKQKGRHLTHKRKLGDPLKAKRESKVLHERYIRSVDRQLIGGEDNLLWLLRGDLKGETGSEIRATKDQALQNKYNSAKI